MTEVTAQYRPLPAQVVAARQVLFGLLFASVVLPAIPFTGLMIVTFLWFAVFSDGRSNREAFLLAAPFVFLGLMGLLMSGDNQQYEMLKDVWYVVKLALCLSVGLLVGRREQDFSGTYPYLVSLSVVAAILSLIILPELAERGVLSLEVNQAAKLSLVALASVPILLERITSGSAGFRWRDVAVLILIAVAAALSDSRITVIAMLIMVLAWAGVFSSFRKALSGGLAVVALGLIVWQLLPEYQGGEMTALNKMRRSFDEIMFTDAYDSTAMIWNWRGFEAYNAQLMFDGGSFWERLFGFGLGAEVNLGQVVQMSQDMLFQYLPTLHNGFYFVLIKFGIVGLVVYAWAVLSWFKWRQMAGATSSSLAVRMLRGMVLIVIASTAVITGLFNRDELHGMTILIAYLLGFLSIWRERSAVPANSAKTLR